MQCGAQRSRWTPLERRLVRPTSPRKLSGVSQGLSLHVSKIWDTATGEALHTFQHNHIVRTVALNPQQQSQYLLTVSVYRG